MPRSLLAALCGLLLLSSPSTAKGPLAELGDCRLTLHVFIDDAARLQPTFVPAGYRPYGWTPGKPFISLWSASCERTVVGGDGPRPVELSVAAVAIEHPDRTSTETPPLEMPNLWAHYVLRFHADDKTLVRRLRRAGFPATHTPGMRLERDIVLDAPSPLRPLAETRVEVPGAWSSWTFPLVQHEPPHSHQNSFWFDAADGTKVLDLRIPLAADHFCELAAGERCGTVTAAAGSETEQLLGAERRSADAAVDHDPIARGVLIESAP